MAAGKAFFTYRKCVRDKRLCSLSAEFNIIIIGEGGGGVAMGAVAEVRVNFSK